MGKDLSTSNTSEKELRLFLSYLTKMDFTEFCGVCRMTGCEILEYDDEGKPKQFKSFEELLENCIDGFCFLSRKRRKNLLKAMKKEIKEFSNRK